MTATESNDELVRRIVEIGEDVAWLQERAVELARRRRTLVNELHARGLTYREIAEALGISPARVGQLRGEGNGGGGG